MNPITIGSSSNVISAGFPVLWASLTAAASEKLDSRPNIFLNTAECVVRKMELTWYWIVVLPSDTSRSISQSPLSTMLTVFSGGARPTSRDTELVAADAVATDALDAPNDGHAVGVEITDCVGVAADPNKDVPVEGVDALGAPNNDDRKGVDATD